ncbi:hypothetical protein AX769_04075 [Frondihabitans sp. PAMC 28766]|nr:hypothetical protein AX769_04075 [Frondihabitans sp. PAMC 28766]
MDAVAKFAGGSNPTSDRGCACAYRLGDTARRKACFIGSKGQLHPLDSGRTKTLVCAKEVRQDQIRLVLIRDYLHRPAYWPFHVGCHAEDPFVVEDVGGNLAWSPGM